MARQGNGRRKVRKSVHIDETLKHFGISDEEAFLKTHLMTPNNSAFFRKELGVDMSIRLMDRPCTKDVRKVRIIIDYDADFPVMVHRIIVQ